MSDDKWMTDEQRRNRPRDIQRYRHTTAGNMFWDDNGEYVTYADHVAAIGMQALIAAEKIREANQQAEYREQSGAAWHHGYEQGQRDERAKWVDLARGDSRAYDLGCSDTLAAAVAAVEALPLDEFVRIDPADAKAAVIAAIKGISDE